MKKENKVVGFVKNHKKAFVITGLIMVGGVIFAVTKTKPIKIAELFRNPNELPIPDMETGKAMRMWSRGAKTMGVEGIVNNIPLSDLGRFGEELMQKMEEVKPDMTMDVIFGVGYGWKE